MGRVYKQLNEEMKLLWNESLRINTVHVEDVCRATWHVANWFVENGKVGSGESFVFNLADKGDTNQETINFHIRAIFGIETGFAGTVVSNFAKLNIESVTEETNEKHLAPWADILKASRIKSSPLTPYLDKELLYKNALSVDGTKITKVTRFEYIVPEVTQAKLVEVIEGYRALNIWPRD
ncbi:hypothetical protein BC936DRAFT_147699 [Jimgerdemannia flammicorona]|uniref:NAD-dependent epimerase/dehydratase domain-containing protein n=1 Tax=Jimgerdemannia flammicorona TaxID=994334 RepID=A0A433D4R1_9FUNG|nr:hypothetical protein BC936DRAFT_147699 [Jimgerdemannia flammicorona]